MPIPTANYIVNDAHDLGCSAVLRLPPANSVEGQQLADVVTRIAELNPMKGSPSGQRTVAIFMDQSNPAYSNDLARDFQYSLRQTSLRSGFNWQVMFQQPIGGDANGVIVTDNIATHFHPNTIVIAGMTDAVLQTMTQEKLVGWKPPVTVLTDGAFSEDLLAAGRNLLDDETYLVFPVDVGAAKVQELNVQLKLSPNEISYAAYGYDAAMLLFLAIDEAANRSGKTSRKAICDEVNRWLDGSPVGDAEDFKIPDDQYRFDELGNSTVGKIGVYKYSRANGQFGSIGDNGR
jgi:hypothetical protein